MPARVAAASGHTLSTQAPADNAKLTNEGARSAGGLENLGTQTSNEFTATEDIKITYSGDELEIGFNSKYIMDIVNNLEDDEISLNLKDNSSPIIALENSNTKLVYVLMPMRV